MVDIADQDEITNKFNDLPSTSLELKHDRPGNTRTTRRYQFGFIQLKLADS